MTDKRNSKDVEAADYLTVLEAFQLLQSGQTGLVPTPEILKEAADCLVLHFSWPNQKHSIVLKKQKVPSANLATTLELVTFSESLLPLLKSYLPQPLYTDSQQPYFLPNKSDTSLQFIELWTGSYFIPNHPVFDWLEAEPTWTDAQAQSSGRLLAKVHLKGFLSDKASSSPGQEKTIVHGDFHPGNVLFQGEEAIAIIDMDYASWDNPLCDLAYALLMFAPLTSYENRALSLLAGYRETFDQQEKALPLNTPDKDALMSIFRGHRDGEQNFSSFLKRAALLILQWLDGQDHETLSLSKSQLQKRCERLKLFLA